MMLALAMVALVAQMLQGKDVVAQIEKNSGGQVTITAPKELESRKVNVKAVAPAGDTSKPKPASAAATAGKKDIEHESEGDRDHAVEHEQLPDESAAHEHQRRLTTTQQHISNRSVGYRIQAYSDNNFRTAKNSAKSRARTIAMKYPQYRSYLTYKAPFWRLKIGDFRTHGEAVKVLGQMRKSFPAFSGELSVVRDKINVWSYE